MSGSFKHGTCAGYERHKCRCDLCRTDHNDRVRRNRAERLARVGSIEHGRRSTYDAGCRCTKCKDARKRAYLAEMASCRCPVCLAARASK